MQTTSLFFKIIATPNSDTSIVGIKWNTMRWALIGVYNKIIATPNSDTSIVGTKWNTMRWALNGVYLCSVVVRT